MCEHKSKNLGFQINLQLPLRPITSRKGNRMKVLLKLSAKALC